jgi:hypothetical protein
MQGKEKDGGKPTKDACNQEQDDRAWVYDIVRIHLIHSTLIIPMLLSVSYLQVHLVLYRLLMPSIS